MRENTVYKLIHSPEFNISQITKNIDVTKSRITDMNQRSYVQDTRRTDRRLICIDSPACLRNKLFTSNSLSNITSQVGWLAQLAERWSLAGELTLFYPWPVADG